MPRFVLLYHDCPPSYERPSHWDLMLESGDALRTWALARLPQNWLSARQRTAMSIPDCPPPALDDSVEAIRLSDHRRDFLEFEGPLSGNRGSVKRVAAGSYNAESEAPDCWRVAFTDGDLSGVVMLTRLSSNDSRWRLECLPAR